MEWYLAFFIFGLIFLLLLGFPIAFSFLAIDLLGILIFMGTGGFKQVTLQIFSSLSTFTLAPIPMFVLMGEIMFHSKLANNTIDVIDTWLGRLPGRLSLLAAAGGTLFSALSGSSIANTAMLGTALLPEMKKRGYKTSMAVGPIIGVGGGACHVDTAFFTGGCPGKYCPYFRGKTSGGRGCSRASHGNSLYHLYHCPLLA